LRSVVRGHLELDPDHLKVSIVMLEEIKVIRQWVSEKKEERAAAQSIPISLTESALLSNVECG
jgi:hypothetical protein